MSNQELDELVRVLSCGRSAAHKNFGDGFFAYIMPMIFNHRICYGDADGVSRAWCYDTRAEAITALEAWDDDTSEPRGWKKSVNDGRRNDATRP